ncbi:YdiU family protein [Paenibacillus sp. GCM10012306]|uniref:protein adenylyltransferase SelO n=1 Tax=Paenibacillus sp. GCM10012306 TaxID=3317342 RepID=UPI00360A6C14
MAEKKAVQVTGWNFDNSYAALPEMLFTRQHPAPVRAPKLAIVNHALASSLGLNSEYLESSDGLAELAGNEVPEGSSPLAQAYAGHQFGHFNMLGDGRALLLGEQITPSGERFDIQLKGSGKTPYSRAGDGRAALGPMLREYIISEAMYGLGIPTTRSLAVVATGQSITRESELPGAVLTRIAASYLRVGTFQYVAKWGSLEDLRTLADYTLHRHYPEAEKEENRYLALLQAVIQRQASLIAQWQLVGFIHGVMNTDNIALSGETIDYGPCAFLDAYDLGTVFSSIDTGGRYAFGNQPNIGAWDLARFAETLLPLLHDDAEQAVKLGEEAISRFAVLFDKHWLSGMRAKLGIFNEESQDEALFEDLLGMMQKQGADYTNTFLALTNDKLEDTALSGTTEFAEWVERWKARKSRQSESDAASQELMRKSNPAVIPRNHRVEEALEAAVTHGDYSVMTQLLETLSDPYAHTPEQAKYCTPAAPSDLPYRTYCGT